MLNKFLVKDKKTTTKNFKGFLFMTMKGQLIYQASAESERS